MKTESRRLVFVVAVLVGGLGALVLWGTKRGARSTARLDSAEIAARTEKTHELTALEASERAPARMPSTPVEEAVPIEAATPAQLGELRGVVRSRVDTQRVEGGRIALFRAGPGPGEPELGAADRAWNRTVGIEADGAVQAGNLVAGPYRILIYATDFEQREELATVVANETTKLDVIVDPLYQTKLDVVLQREVAPNLFVPANHTDLEVIGALQLVLLETCPGVGTDLSEKARRLTRVRSTRSTKRDAWMTAGFSTSSGGCACAVLAGRVLAAVPFESGQASVVLTVKDEDLTCCRSTLDVVVVEEGRRAPIPGASVVISRTGGTRRTLETSNHGVAHADDLFAGDLRIQVSAPGYTRVIRRLTLDRSTPARTETVELERTIVLRGSVRFPASGALMYTVTASRVDSASKKPQRSVVSNETTFEIPDLVPGEYAIGITPVQRIPNTERVRRNEIEGWKIVDLRKTTDVGLEFEITESIAQRIRAGQER